VIAQPGGFGAEMETRLIITEDTSERTVVLVQRRPWNWGGPRIYEMALFPLTWPLMLLSKKRVVFDKTLQRVVSDSRFLVWHRRKEIPFSDIQLVDASYRLKTVLENLPSATSHGGTYVHSTTYLLNSTVSLCDLSLTLTSGEEFSIGTSWPDPRTKAVGQKVAEVTRKPFVWLGDEQRD